MQAFKRIEQNRALHDGLIYKSCIATCGGAFFRLRLSQLYFCKGKSPTAEMTLFGDAEFSLL
jgi:hypothetical protein